MNWMSLDTSPKSLTAEYLRDQFLMHPHIIRWREELGHWTRQLDWASSDEFPEAYAWLDVESGNLVLIEAVGDEGSVGVVTARLRVGSTGFVLDLVDPDKARYGAGSDRSLPGMLALTLGSVTSIPALKLPS